MRIHSHKVSDHLLLAFLRGDVDETTAAQIEADPASLERVYELMCARQQSMQPLLPPDAVSEMELGAYRLGVLPEAQAREVEKFLAENPGRRAEFAMLDGFLEELADELPGAKPVAEEETSGLLDGVKTLIAQLVSGLGSGMTPAFALRGEEDGPRTYEVGDIQIGLEIQDDLTIPGRKAIVGTMLGAETAGWKVELWQDDLSQKVSEGEVDELGVFEIDTITPDGYALIFKDGNTEIHIPDLEVRA